MVRNLGEDELMRVKSVSPCWFHCRWMNLLAWHVAGVWLFLVVFICLACCFVVCFVVLCWSFGGGICLAIHPVLPSYKGYEASDGLSEMGTRPDA